MEPWMSVGTMDVSWNHGCQLAAGAIQNSHRDQLSLELEVREEGARSLNILHL